MSLSQDQPHALDGEGFVEERDRSESGVAIDVVAWLDLEETVFGVRKSGEPIIGVRTVTAAAAATVCSIDGCPSPLQSPPPPLGGLPESGPLDLAVGLHASAEAQEDSASSSSESKDQSFLGAKPGVPGPDVQGVPARAFAKRLPPGVHSPGVHEELAPSGLLMPGHTPACSVSSSLGQSLQSTASPQTPLTGCWVLFPVLHAPGFAAMADAQAPAAVASATAALAADTLAAGGNFPGPSTSSTRERQKLAKSLKRTGVIPDRLERIDDGTTEEETGVPAAVIAIGLVDVLAVVLLAPPMRLD